MATATTKNTTRKTESKKSSPKPPSQQKKQTQRWVIGFFFLMLGVYALVSVLSFFLYWKEDQALAEWSSLSQATEQIAVNWGGHLGAVISNTLVNHWFGVFGICIPFVFIIIGIRILRFIPPFLRRSIRIGLLLMIIGSVAAAYLFNNSLWNWEVFGSGLGGGHGVFISMWLRAAIGEVGAGLLILTVAILFAVYVNSNAIYFLNRFGSGLWHKTKQAGDLTATVATLPFHKKEDPEIQPDGVSEIREEADPVQSDVAAELDEYVLTDLADQQKCAELIDRTEALETVERPDEDSKFIVNRYPEESGTDHVSLEPIASAVAENATQAIYPFIDEPIENQEETDPACIGIPEEVDEFEIEDRSEKSAEGPELIIGKTVDEEQLSDDAIELGFYDHTLDLSYYQKPPVDLLEDHRVDVEVSKEELTENKNRIIETLDNFGIKIDKIMATPGPTVTLYEIIPAPGIRISKIKNLEDDIALSLSALGIRIIAPIPGKGTIGIEVPNKDKKIVSMYSVIKSVRFQESTYDLPIVLGKTIQNETFVLDLAKMPHLLVAGATGQGKSVGLNAILTSLLYKKHPSEIKFVLVDPKKVELTLYAKLEKHFLAKLPSEDDAIITDTQKVINTLNSLCIEMDARYDLLRKAEVRHIREYNEKFIKRRLNPNKGHRYLPYIVVIIDEFADLIMTAGREIEGPISRLAQLARAIGIHLVIATQRPTTNIITGVIKANFPARIAFRVSSMIDSRTIIDQPGANQLIGRGDMLVSTGNDLVRVQCAFVDTPEVERVTEFISKQQGYPGPYELPDYVPDMGNGTTSDTDLSHRDSLFEQAARMIVSEQQGSTSLIQRKFSIGYNRAGRIMDQMEAAGVVGKADGSKTREVLIADMMSLEMIISSLDRS